MKFIDPILKVLVFLSLLPAGGCTAEDYSDCQRGTVFNLSYVLNKDSRDKFDSQVETVDLLIYNEAGTITRELHYAPASNRIQITDLPRGEYKAVFWANRTEDHFVLDGTADINSHTLALRNSRENEVHSFDSSLFHAYTEFRIRDYGIDETGVPLVKNTNRVTVRLTNDAGKPVTGDYRVTISGSNAVYNYDNSLVAGQPSIIYHPFVEREGTGEHTYELNIGRMRFGDDLHVDITKGGKPAGHIPLVETLAENSPLLKTDRDLDRYDEYELSYSLGGDGTLVLTLIRINDWQRIIQNGGLN